MSNDEGKGCWLVLFFRGGDSQANQDNQDPCLERPCSRG
jgi:hypothetical protein